MSDQTFCAQYESAIHSSDFGVFYAYILERALGSVPQSGSGLDIACGPAILLSEFARRRPDMTFTGVDLSHAMLEQARRNVEKQGLANVRLLYGNMSDLPEILGDETFDWVTCTFSLHYSRDADQALAVLDGVARVLRPGACFFLADLTRFKREVTRQWFANKYDRGVGEEFFREILDSYLASFSLEEFMDLLQQSRLSGGTVEWSCLLPVLVVAHNLHPGRRTRERVDLSWLQRLKHGLLRSVLRLSAVRSGF